MPQAQTQAAMQIGLLFLVFVSLYYFFNDTITSKNTHFLEMSEQLHLLENKTP